MKKRVLLLITLIVSLFIYSGRVEAAKELTCIYESNAVLNTGTLLFHNFMIFQDSKGNISALDSNPFASFSDLNDPGWRYYDYINGESTISREFVFEFDTTNYSNGELKKCPENFDFSTEKDTIIITLSDDANEYRLIQSYNYLPKNIDYTFEASKDYSDKISNTEWAAKCDYDEYSLYFNKNELLLIDNTHSSSCMSSFSIDSLYSTLYGACPPALYLNDNFYNDVILFSLSENLEIANNFAIGILGDRLVITGKNYFEQPQIVDNQCDKLLCEDTIDKIMKYFNIIKIAIPIILVGLGIFDFSKAVFGNDDDMKKARKTFILRIVAAILFFLSPIFIRFILSVANNVWDYISPDTYIK